MTEDSKEEAIRLENLPKKDFRYYRDTFLIYFIILPVLLFGYVSGVIQYPHMHGIYTDRFIELKPLADQVMFSGAPFIIYVSVQVIYKKLKYKSSAIHLNHDVVVVAFICLLAQVLAILKYFKIIS